MTEQELIQENEKLKARLQKAVTVFGEQKATIERLTAERDQALSKAQEASTQDDTFFEQQEEINNLNDAVTQLRAQVEEDVKTKEEYEARLGKAAEAFNKQKNELEKLNSVLEAEKQTHNDDVTKLNLRITQALEVYNAQEAKIEEANKQLEQLTVKYTSAIKFVTELGKACNELVKGK